MKATISEADFTRQVLDLARLLGWRTAHFRPGMMRSGKWVTPVQGDGKGFPDLVLVRGPVLLFVELKVGRNKITFEQGMWLAAFKRAGQRALLWTPADWPDIEKVLRGDS